MKALRCQTDPCGRGLTRAMLRARQVMGYSVVMLPGGEPYIIGSPTFPLVAKCAACKRPSTYKAADFARLPDVTVAQLEAMSLLEPLTRDWVGSGVPHEHARDMIGAGLMGPAEVEPRKEPPAKTYRTGSRAPLSGVYRAGDSTIPLSKGEKFPPSGGQAADWTLEREA